jgi:Grx4 family monothiol glutaredoxin
LLNYCETNMDVQKIIHDQVTSNPVVLYMKGSPAMPRCGFSANATQILRACGVTQFVAVDVLADEAIRQGIKEYASWPTIPSSTSRESLSVVRTSCARCMNPVS